MPAGDKTGPEGKGALTGRGAGYCAGYDQPGYMDERFDNPRRRLGKRRWFGRLGGRGRGRGRRF